jgi:hypothetical protein
MWKEVLLASVLAIALGAGPSLAQEPAGEKGPAPPAATAAPPAAPSEPSPDVTAAPSGQSSDADALTGLPIYSSDGQQIGAVTAVKMGADGKAQSLQAEIGGFLGFGGKTVEITSGTFQRTGDRVALSITAEEAGKLPEVEQQ